MRSVVVLLGLMDRPRPRPTRCRRPQTVQAPAHNPLDCYCRAQGRMFAEGEKVCLRTAEGPRLAQCQMEINVMSWSVTETPCPECMKKRCRMCGSAETELEVGPSKGMTSAVSEEADDDGAE